MITTARQLKDLIRNMSKKKSADAQILMRNYMMERFLERISLSEYKNQFILKGGMLVAAMVGLDARATMDLDATIKGTNVSVEDVEMIISQIISIPLDDGVSFRVKRISEIMEEADYPGVRVSMETKFDGVITPLKIDISTGDVITPREIKYKFNLNLSVNADPEKLARVFSNLLRNAASYSYPQTEITISAKRLEHDIQITFENHGKTIPQEQLNSIFEKFNRLDDARLSNTGGAGLGLSIAEEIIHLHGGKITASSQNETIDFVITLPLSA